MSRQIIHNEKHTLKPHNSPAIKVNGFIFCSGQVGFGEIKKATAESIEKLGEVIELGGSSLEKVVKYNIFLKDMADFDAMNEAFIAALPEGPKPARTCVQAGKLPGGPNATIEIECTVEA